MKSKKFQFDKFITSLRWPVALAGAVYLSCMVVAPWIMGGGSWSYVQEVWDRWQSVNVAILAFGASFIAFEISRYKESRQSEREFLAARAYLPDTLSNLSSYLSACANIHMNGWNNHPQPALPIAPADYREVFANCIRHATDEAGEQLSQLLMWLQVHAARLERLYRQPASSTDLKKLEALTGLRLDGELMGRVNRLFDFARGEGELDNRPLDWEDYRTAYANLGLHVEDLVLGKESLYVRTMEHIAKQSKGRVEDSGT